MLMKEIQYQQKAVAALKEKLIAMLGRKRDRQKLVFKAPTGSGKTVMASEVLWKLTEELPTRSDCPYHQVAYVWIAPNKLHEQSYFKMKSYFSETNTLRPVIYDELDLSGNSVIQPGEILFVNWESINKDNALMIRDTEQNRSLYDITRRTTEQGIALICIIDEEHLFGGRLTNKAEKVLTNINAKVEFRISATPITSGDDSYTIDREEVVKEQMIKSGLVLNPALKPTTMDEASMVQYLTRQALDKRNELQRAYQKVGSNVKPLLLIQLPNDTSASLSSEETQLAEEVKEYLDKVKGISAGNGKLAIWLSNEKTNLEGIERNDSLVEVLLFKQAIALGWDCPRAAVLLIFRKLESFTFTVQTVGRIMRMPEQHFYAEPCLNQGYIYTDLSKDKIAIVQDDMDYISTLVAHRREGLQNVTLTSAYKERPSGQRNRLGPDFKRVLRDTFKELWLLNIQKELLLFPTEEEGEGVTNEEEGAMNIAAKNRITMRGKIRFDVNTINVEIPQDVKVEFVPGIQDISSETFKYARTAGEVDRVFRAYCREQLGSFEKAHSTDVLANYLLEILEELFEIFETEAKKVVLYHENKPRFSDVIQKALARYAKILEKRQKKLESESIKTYEWKVPEDRIYNEKTNIVLPDVRQHAMMPFIRLRQCSMPEEGFEQFLEQNKQYIDWWYKNGDEGMQNYAVAYEKKDEETKGLFYVDFVLRMKNGQIFLFDTKSKDSDEYGPEKHNALKAYMKSEDNREKHLQGGIIIKQGENWLYSTEEIENTTDLSAWKAFFPQDYK